MAKGGELNTNIQKQQVPQPFPVMAPGPKGGIEGSSDQFNRMLLQANRDRVAPRHNATLYSNDYSYNPNKTSTQLKTGVDGIVPALVKALFDPANIKPTQSSDEGPSTGDYGNAGPAAPSWDSNASSAEQEVGEYAQYDNPDDSEGSDGGGSGSYIATATTQELGKDGLEVFDNWREHMKVKLPTFKLTYGRYRATAPSIVKNIDARFNKEDIYKSIWHTYLEPIKIMISSGDDAGALGLYRVMVKKLKEDYYAK